MGSCFAMQLNPAHPSEHAQEKSPLVVPASYRAPLDESCGICLEKPTPPIVVLTCSHHFCEACINTWRINNPHHATCPICRAQVPPVSGLNADWTVPVFPVTAQIQQMDADEGFCCSWKRFKRGYIVHSQETCFNVCTCPYFLLTMGCMCSCMNRDGYIIPYLQLARCASCQCRRPLSEVDPACYLCTTTTACCAELAGIIFLTTIIHV